MTIQLFSTACMLIGFLILGWALSRILAERRHHEDFLRQVKRLREAADTRRAVIYQEDGKPLMYRD